MSQLYLTASSDTVKTSHTARGHRYVTAALQSWSGSVGITLWADGRVIVTADQGSTDDPKRIAMETTMAELMVKVGITVINI